MSGNSQKTREDEQGDLLEQIITQGLDQLNASAQASAAEGAPADGPPPTSARKDGEDAAPPPAGRKDKRSAFYFYLLILFGAAFLMLLLAYFVQQRSNASLRDSMNLSRDVLLDEIRALEEENEALTEELARLKARWEAYEAQVEQEIRYWSQDYGVAKEYLSAWNSFWELERYYQAGDLQGCAVVLIMQAQGQYTYNAPDPGRQEEIIQAVIGAGILDKDYYLHPKNYNDLMNAFFVEHTVGTTVKY